MVDNPALIAQQSGHSTVAVTSIGTGQLNDLCTLVHVADTHLRESFLDSAVWILVVVIPGRLDVLKYPSRLLPV